MGKMLVTYNDILKKPKFWKNPKIKPGFLKNPDSDREKGESVKEKKRNKDDSGDGGDYEDYSFDDDNESMIVMGLRWDVASKYRWEMTMTKKNDGWWILNSVKMNVD